MGYEGCLLLCSCAKASIAADSQHARGCVGLVLHSVNGVLIHSKKQVGALVDEEERIEVRFYRPDDNVVMLTHPIGQAAASCWGLVLDHETMALKRCADVSVCSRSKQARASIGKVLSNVNGAPVRTPADVRAAMGRYGLYFKALDCAFGMRKGMEIDLARATLQVGRMVKVLADENNAEVPGMTKREKYNAVGRLLRMCDAIQEVLLEAGSQTQRCWECNEERKR